MKMKFLAGAGLALTLGGCAFEPALTAKIVDYNRVADESTNSLLLLNILRAKERRPMTMTTITQFNPNISGEISGNASIPFSPIAYTLLTLSTGARLTSSNQATVGVENVQKFMKGFTTPIDAELFDYFFQQGWPYEVLFHLFVQKIEAVRETASDKPDERNEVPGTRVRVYINSPRATRDRIPRSNSDRCPINVESDGHKYWEDFECYQEVIRAMRPLIRFGTIDTSVKIGPRLYANDLRRLDQLAKIAELKLKLKDEKTHFQLYSPRSMTVLCFSPPGIEPDDDYFPRSSDFGCKKSQLDKKGVYTARAGGTDAKTQKQVRGILQRLQLRKKSDVDLQQRIATTMIASIEQKVQANEALAKYCNAQKNEYCKFTFHLRSPEAMIYYLGEVVRADMASAGRSRVMVRLRGEKRKELQEASARGDEQKDGLLEPLFLVHEGRASDVESAASVSYEGRTYHVPKGGNRAMQVMSLLLILVGLQREAIELPRTTTVTLSSQ